MMNLNAMAQNTMSPELLLKLGRVTTLGLSKDGKNIVYKVAIPSAEENKSNSKLYTLPINGGNPTEVASTKELLNDKNISPDGKYLVYDETDEMANPKGSFRGIDYVNIYNRVTKEKMTEKADKVLINKVDKNIYTVCFCLNIWE